MTERATPRRIGKAGRAGQRRAAGSRIGLALAGGGPLGATYEIGALLALAEALEGVDLNDLDAYVGVSSGGFVAAGLASGISPAQMYRLFIDEGADTALSPAVFLRPATGEFTRRALTVPGLLASATREFLRQPFRRGAVASFATLGRAVPTGLFDQGSLDAFLVRLFATGARTNDFRTLGRKLFVVATDLDSGGPVIFGKPGFDHVPINKAIAASAALPGLFPPVEIDGRYYVDGALNKTLHASVALDERVDLLLCVNPLVPFDASSAAADSRLTVETIKQGGLPLVLAQTFRAIIHSRMKVGMEKYRRQYPRADIVLFEPEREDADMFLANIFSYAQRTRICEAAYHKTRQRLLAQSATLRPMLARHGIQLDVERLALPRSSIRHALTDPRSLSLKPPSIGRAVRDLVYTLDHLEHWLAQAWGKPTQVSAR